MKKLVKCWLAHGAQLCVIMKTGTLREGEKKYLKGFERGAGEGRRRAVGPIV
jgi:hypothetical protein